jgi:hypothetical protein
VVTSFQIVLKPTFDMPEIDIDSIVKWIKEVFYVIWEMRKMGGRKQ